MSQPGSLAERLRLLREAARLTGDQLAERLGWSEKTGRTKVSKIENGRQWPTPDETSGWAEACGHPEVAGELLIALEDEQTAHKSWRGRLRQGQAPVQEDYDRRVRASTRYLNSAPNVIPALLQTSAYARAILAQGAAVFGTVDVEAALQARLKRQDVVYDPSKIFQFVITEAALRLLPCPPDVMLGQLAWLERLLSIGLDHVTIGIIPFGVPLPVQPTTDFLLLDDRAIVETSGSEDEVGPAESAMYADLFERLMTVALTGDDARRLIAAAVEDLRGTIKQRQE
jgi:transcriptional regulator with XRE-family HTH domain